MTDVLHGVLVAVGTQTDASTIDADIRDLHDATSVSSTDGIILGDAESGDDGTGITLPEFVRVFDEVGDVNGSFTKSASMFTRVSSEGMTISFRMKGNGASSTPLADEAQPLAGIDALWLACGLEPAADSAPTYSYAPLSGTQYVSIRLWSAGQTWLFKSCVVESMSVPLVGGESTVVTASIRIGSIADDTTDGAGSDPEIVPLPTTIDYGTQATLTPPRSENVTFTWGAQARCYGELTLDIANTIEELTDSCQTSGIRLSQSERAFNIAATLWQISDTSQTDYEWRQLIDEASTSSASLSVQIGAVAGPAGTLNAYLLAMNLLDVQSLNYEKAGAFNKAVFSAVCTGTTADSEFLLTFN